MPPRKPLDTCDIEDLLITLDDLPKVRKRETGAMITHTGELWNILKQKGIVIPKVDLDPLLSGSIPTRGSNYSSGMLIPPGVIDHFITHINQRTLEIWEGANKE